MVDSENGNGAWCKELLLERYCYMLSEKSGLVFTVMLSRSKACQRCYGWLLEHMRLQLDPLGHL